MSTVTRLEDRHWVAVGKFCRQAVDLMGSSVPWRARAEIDKQVMTFPRMIVNNMIREEK